MIIPSILAYRYVFTFSARRRPCSRSCSISEVYLFTVPLSDESAFHAFLDLISSEISPDVREDVACAVGVPSSGWVFAILDGRSARFFGVSSIVSVIAFFHAFYRQFRGLDDFGFYDSYIPAPIAV